MSCFDVQILNPDIYTIQIETCIGDQPASIDVITYDNTSSIEINHCVPLLSEIEHILPVQNILGGSGIVVSSNSGIYTISSTGLQPSGNYSLVGHTHTSSNITDFKSAVSGLLPSISGSGYVNSSFNNNIYTISVSGLQPSGNYSLVGHTHTSSNITDFNSAVSGLIPPSNFTSLSGVSGIIVTNSGTNYFVGLNDPSIQLADITDLSVNARTFLLNSSSDNFRTLINDETGFGALVFNYSPVFLGAPTVPTAASGTNTNQIASTAFVRTAISNLIDSAPSTLDTLNELAAALGDDPNFATTITNSLAGKANAIHNHGNITSSGTIGSVSGLLIMTGANGALVTSSGINSSYITNFNSSVSGLLPVTNILGGTNIIVSSNSGIYTIGTSGVQSLFTTTNNTIAGNTSISAARALRYNALTFSPVTADITLPSSGHLIGDVIVITSAGGSFANGSVLRIKNPLGQTLDTITKQNESYSYISESNGGPNAWSKVLVDSHSHVSSDITNFNSSVSGLLPAVTGVGQATSSFNNNTYTISVSGLQPSGNYSTVGHTHTASNITDFASGVSGLLPSVSGSGYAVSSFANNIYTISVTGLQPSGNYSIVGHTHVSNDITDFSSSVSGLLPVKNVTGSGYVNVSSSSGIYNIAVTGLQPSGNYANSIHSHGNITSSGTIGTTAGKAIVTSTSGLLIASDSVTNSQWAYGLYNNQADPPQPYLSFDENNFYWHDGLFANNFRASINAASSVHSHGDITNSGTIGSTSGLLVVTGSGGVLTTSSGVSSSYITNFNSSVSGLLPVKNILGSGYINVGSSSGVYTISATGLQPSGNYSVVDHNHGNITSSGTIGSTIDQVLITDTDGVIIASDYAPKAIILYDPTNDWDIFYFQDTTPVWTTEAITNDVPEQFRDSINAAASIHSHGNISSSGAIGSTSGLLVITGNSGVLTTTSGITSSYITNFNSSVSGLLPTISNSGNNRILTSTGSSVGINAENNLTFDGNILQIYGGPNSGGSGIIFQPSQSYTDGLSKIIFDGNNINAYIEADEGSELFTIYSNAAIAISGSSLMFNGTNISVNGHTHSSVDITDFNSSVSGLLPSVSGSGYAISSFANNIYTISVTGLQPSGNYSVVGHTHVSNDITDFSSTVSGLLPVKNIVAGTSVNVSSVSGEYTISVTGVAATSASSLTTTCHNLTGSTIPKLSAVYINGGHGNEPTINLAIANSEAGSSKTFGITMEDINFNQSGDVVVVGSLIDVNTNQFGAVEGTTLYLSPSVSGALTTTKPLAPNHIVSLGKIIRNHTNQGVIEVSVQNGFELDELHNVSTNGSGDNGKFLQYNSSSGLWVPSSSGNFTTLQVNGTGVVASSGGNSGYLSKFTASNTIDNSVIYQSGSNVGIGITNPQTLIHASGLATGVGSLFRLQNGSSSSNTYFETRIGTPGNFDNYIFFNRNGTNFFGATNTSQLYLPNHTQVASNRQITSESNANAVLNLYNASAQTELGYVSGNALRFLRNYVEVARFDGNGNFGIGTTTPSGQLHVVGTGIISSRLGIGTNNPSVPLEVAGNAFIDGNLVFDSFTESVVAIGNSSTSQTLSLASGTVHTCTLTGNCTFTMPTATAGKSFTMFLNTGSGNYTANFSGVLWNDSAPPTITTTASKVDILSFISDGSYWYGSYSQNYG